MRIVRSDREGEFEAVYRECLRDVRLYASAHVGTADVDDVVNATFISVWQRLDDVPALSRRAWVIGVCRNHCRNRWRTNRRFDALTDAVVGARPDVEQSLSQSSGVDIELRTVFAGLVADLSPSERELLVLAGWLEYSPTEIADVLGVMAGTVRVRLHRLRRSLARGLGNDIIDHDHHEEGGAA